MDRKELDALKEKANLQIEDIFDKLGIEYSERYKYIVAPCPVHGGDRADAFSWHVDKSMWKCFSRGCESATGHDIIGLICGIRSCSFMQGVRFLESLIGKCTDPEEIKRLRDQKQNREFIEAKRKAQEAVRTYPKESLQKLTPHNYLQGRGYPEWLCEKYQIGACLSPRRYMSNRIVVPVINKDGEIVGFTGRTLDPDWADKKIPKWKHSRGSWVSRNLFNINFAQKYIHEHSTVILTEGPLDVLRLEQAGVKIGAAILGKKFYPDQMTIIAGCGATKIIDALDADAAGQSGSRGILKTASCLFDIEKVELPEGRKDIGEMSIEEIREVFSEYVEAEALRV